jgi:hypothetical protein
MWLGKGWTAELLGEAISAILILILYLVQLFILRSALKERTAARIYLLMMVLSTPLCWGLSPCWHNPQCYPMATLIGWPITVHAVPMWSFHRGLALREQGKLSRWWRTVLLHVLVALPIWYCVWPVIQMACLGFMWI